MKKIHITAILLLSFLISGCGLLYVALLPAKPSTCGYHFLNDLDFPENTIYLKSFSILVKPNKEVFIEQYLSKGNYCVHYYHCNGPIDAKLEIKKNNKQLCLLDFSLAKKQSVYFSAEELGDYQFKLESSSKWTVNFFLLKDMSKKE